MRPVSHCVQVSLQCVCSVLCCLPYGFREDWVGLSQCQAWCAWSLCTVLDFDPIYCRVCKTGRSCFLSLHLDWVGLSGQAGLCFRPTSHLKLQVRVNSVGSVCATSCFDQKPPDTFLLACPGLWQGFGTEAVDSVIQRINFSFCLLWVVLFYIEFRVQNTFGTWVLVCSRGQ